MASRDILKGIEKTPASIRAAAERLLASGDKTLQGWGKSALIQLKSYDERKAGKTSAKNQKGTDLAARELDKAFDWVTGAAQPYKGAIAFGETPKAKAGSINDRLAKGERVMAFNSDGTQSPINASAPRALSNDAKVSIASEPSSLTPLTTDAPASTYFYGADVMGKKANDAAVRTLYKHYFQRDPSLAELENWGSMGGDDTTVQALEDFLQSEKVRYSPANVDIADAGASAAGDLLSGTYKEMYDSMKSYLDELKRRGEVLNQKVEITPDRVAEFLKKAETDIDLFMPQAKKEILPYYQNELKKARENLLRSVGYTRDEIIRQEEDLEREYGRTLRSLGETAAETGFAQSGLRQRDERDLAEGTQRALDSNRRALSFEAGNAARQFAGTYGARELPSFSLDAAPKVSAGKSTFSRSGSPSPFYNLSDSVYAGLKGSQEYEQEAALRGRASELEGAYRTNEDIERYRQLTF